MNQEQINIAQKAVNRAKRSLFSVFGFSFVVSLLLLTSPLFMLQVYDRVLISRSSSTLVGLLGVALFLLFILWLVEVVRNLLINRISVRLNNDLAQITFSEVLARGAVSKPVHDLNTLRSFMSSPYLLSLFDIPWLPAYIACAYFLHPMLGHVGVIGAVVLFCFAIINDLLTREPSEKSSQYYGGANSFVEHSAKNQEAVMGMGMLRNLSVLWSQLQAAGLGYQMQSQDRNAWVSSSAKVVRQVIQVSVLAMGGYLVIGDHTTPGAMIAASIIIGRALAPIEQSIQGWRQLSGVRLAYSALKEFLENYEEPKASVELPRPEGAVTVQNVVALGSSGEACVQQTSGAGLQPVIKSASLSIRSGEALGITGPSGSGKSTLARLILGVTKPISGSVRIDGAELTNATQRQFAPFFGFLPQEVGLFDGTVAENICRFGDQVDEKVVEAAKLAGAHELILSLPEGYETPIGDSGIHLSAGQKQRVGLARAVYDSPCLVVLDEPHANLDQTGTKALRECINKLKERGSTIVLIAHQPAMFAGMDSMAMVVDGQIQDHGPATEMFEKMGVKLPSKDKPKTATAPSTISDTTPSTTPYTTPSKTEKAGGVTNIVKAKPIKPVQRVQVNARNNPKVSIRKVEPKS